MTGERSLTAWPVFIVVGGGDFGLHLSYCWAMSFHYGNGYWWGDKGIPAQPEDMDAYEALEKRIMEKYHLKEPFIWT